MAISVESKINHSDIVDMLIHEHEENIELECGKLEKEVEDLIKSSDVLYKEVTEKIQNEFPQMKVEFEDKRNIDDRCNYWQSVTIGFKQGKDYLFHDTFTLQEFKKGLRWKCVKDLFKLRERIRNSRKKIDELRSNNTGPKVRKQIRAQLTRNTLNNCEDGKKVLKLMTEMKRNRKGSQNE